MAEDRQYCTDGDVAFSGVDTRKPAHLLGQGIAAGAINKRIEDGSPRPRFGVGRQPWGRPGNLAEGKVYTAPEGGDYYFSVTGFTVGNRYTWKPVDAYKLSTGISVVGHNTSPSGTVYTEATTFAATATGYYVWRLLEGGAYSNLVTQTELHPESSPRGYCRFSDPGTGEDTAVLVTDEWRVKAGEDGGRGRAWRILPGQSPIEIPLNGHDVWGECRLIPCFNGAVLIRQGNERHYFGASAVDTVNSRIQLNSAPAWTDGELVYFYAFPDSYILGSAPPNPGTKYWVKNITGNKVELYEESGMSTKLTMTGGALGRFYLERAATEPGAYGNGAPSLLMQTASGKTAAENGFNAVASSVLATAWDATLKTVTAINHRLIPGDSISYTHSGGTTTTYYVYPMGDDYLRLFTTLDKSLANLIADAQDPTFASGDTLKKTTASGLPMPPGREGLYTKNNRLLLANGMNTVCCSDPLDPMHFTPMQSEITANLGEADPLTCMMEVGSDAVLIAKEGRLHMLNNFSAGPTGWVLQRVTNEYGFVAPRSGVSVGKDGWGLSRKGVVSVTVTEQGQIQGVALPVSYPMAKYIDMIDWRYASRSCGAAWNNRVFFAVPLKGQMVSAGGWARNNGVLVFNLLTQAWEGLWQGDELEVYEFARVRVFGEERLTWVNYDGQVSWFHDGWVDLNGQWIEDELLTRCYTGANVPTGTKTWLQVEVVWDTQSPTLTVDGIAPGYNEVESLASELTYDPTKYVKEGVADYDPTTGNFDAPDREDYSLTPGEILSGAVDVHQNITERFRMRNRDWGMSVRIRNASGSARIRSVKITGVEASDLSSRGT